jgi:hypothetical protein
MVAVSLLALGATAWAVTLADPVQFTIVATHTPSLPRAYGGIRFSADGTILYAVGDSDAPSSALYAMTVTRDAGSGRVVSLGTPTTVFAGEPSWSDPAGLDAGLEFGPAGTLFYTYFPSPNLAQRPGGLTGMESELTVPGVTSLAGLTFSPHRPDPGTGFGRLQVTTGLTHHLYEVPLAASATPGLFVIPQNQSLELFAKLYRPGPPRVGGQGATGLAYVPGGQYAGDLLYTSFVEREIWRVVIDPATGLPDGGANTPTESLFAEGFTTPPFGLAFDPVHPDSLFVTTWDDAAASGNAILEITGFGAFFPTTTSSTSTTTSSSSSTSTAPAPSSTSTPTSTSTSSTTSAVPTTTIPTTTTTTTTSSTSSSTAPTETTTSTTSSTTSAVPTTTPTTTSSTSSSTVPTETTSSTTSSSAAPSTVVSTSSSTTSTTSPAGCDPSDPAACDDGDPCTDDACLDARRCQNTPLGGLASLTCACEIALPSACRDVVLPARLGALRTKACTLLGRAHDLPANRLRRPLRRAARLFGRAAALAARAGRTARISADCASALAHRLGASRDRAIALSGPR